MGASLNRVELLGRLGRDPEQKTSQNGSVIATLSIATESSFKDKSGQWQKTTDWHRVTIFGKQAENACRYLHKGSLVLIEGSLRYRTWEGQDGQKHSATDIVAQSVQFLDSKPREGGAPQQQGQGGYNGNYAYEDRYENNSVDQTPF